jgi:transcriptional regulator with XRE-family HTH domain
VNLDRPPTSGTFICTVNAPLLSSVLRERRLAAGLGVRELAAAAGVSAGYISRVEGRGEAPGAAVLARIATALGADIDDLLRLGRDAASEAAATRAARRFDRAAVAYRRSRSGEGRLLS